MRDKTLEEMEMSVRLAVDLGRLGIRTVRQLAAHTIEELSRRQVGKKSLKEATQILTEEGLEWGTPMPVDPQPEFTEAEVREAIRLAWGTGDYKDSMTPDVILQRIREARKG